MHTPSAIHEACATAGRFMITEGSSDPAVVLPRLLAALAELAPDAHEKLTVGFSLFPDHALEDELSRWWNSDAGTAALDLLFEALNEHAPEGFALGPANDWLDLGFLPIEETLQHTLLVPFSKTPTEWHPTEETGPWSLLTRGNFDRVEEADAWATAHLRGQPYSVRTMRKLDGKTVSEQPRPSGVVPREDSDPPPRMMPGQAPYTREEQAKLDGLIAGAALATEVFGDDDLEQATAEDEREWDDSTMGGRDQFEDL